MLDLVQMESQKENSAIRGIERRLMKSDRLTTYIACEELDFTWCEEQVKEFEKLWKLGRKNGKTNIEMIIRLSEHFKRTQEEVAILLIDRGMKSRI